MVDVRRDTGGSMNDVKSADGSRIVFDRSGAGPALVLVVGAFNDRSSTKSLASGLSSTFTVYEYDRRGRGASDEAGPYAVEREIEDLAAVIEASGGSAFVFGHSSGGALALESAASGVPVRGLVVHEPPYTEGPSRAFAARLAEMDAAGQQSDAVEAFLRLMGTPDGVLEQMKSGPYWEHMLSFAHTLSYEIRLCNDGKVPAERLARIAVPTLVLAGGASPDWAHDVAQTTAAAIPGSQARILDGQGHGVADDVLIPILRECFV